MTQTATLTSHIHENTLSLSLGGVLDLNTTADILGQLVRFQEPLPREIRLDLGAVTHMDDCGALVIMRLQKMAARNGSRLERLNTPDAVRDLLAFLRLDAEPAPKDHAYPERPGFFADVGRKTLALGQQMGAHVTFVGEIVVALLTLLRRPGELRLPSVVLAMQKVGVEALPIVGLISFLLGLIMAFMSAAQLQQFGANIYVASLVGLAMVRELGPIMTAIIVAGRSGSAFAAEIGTMKISEEVDALVTLGFDPVVFLVIPRLMASLLVVPFLVLYSDIFAIGGGLLMGITVLDLTPGAYMAQTVKTLFVFDIAWGLFKSALFAVLIASVGCFKGLQVRGGAASVGQATTSAVVTSIFLVILTDSVLAVILRYWRP